MPALVAGIRVFLAPLSKQGVDSLDKPSDDEQERWFDMTGTRSKRKSLKIFGLVRDQEASDRLNTFNHVLRYLSQNKIIK
jgi:hypothetical protein